MARLAASVPPAVKTISRGCGAEGRRHHLVRLVERHRAPAGRVHEPTTGCRSPRSGAAASPRAPRGAWASWPRGRGRWSSPRAVARHRGRLYARAGRILRCVDVLTTDRLRLRRLTPADTDDLLRGPGRPGGDGALPGTQGSRWRRRLDRWAMDSYEANGFGLWAIERAADGAFLGDCGPMLQPVGGWPWLPEIGYHLIRREWGHGYATEAAEACLAWVFGRPAMTASAPSSSPENLPSRRVAERVHRQRRDDHLGAHGLRDSACTRRPASSSPSPRSRAARSAARISCRARRVGQAISSRRGGSAPVRRHVSAATATATSTASRRIRSSPRPARAPPRSMNRARNAPPKASPAPTVSTTSTAGTSTSKATRRPMTRTGRGPSVSRMTVGPRASSALAAASGRRLGRRCRRDRPR